MQLHVADDQLPAELAANPRLRRVLDLLEHVIQVARSAIRRLRPTNRNWQDLERAFLQSCEELAVQQEISQIGFRLIIGGAPRRVLRSFVRDRKSTSELQSHLNLVCRLLLEKKKQQIIDNFVNQETH